MHYKKLAFLLSVSVGSLCSMNAQAQTEATTTAEVKPCIQFGADQVCGTTIPVDEKNVDIFFGIPYAESTAGKNRWQPPKGINAWEGKGTLQATQPGKICPQPGQTAEAISEDCLFLNVWTPSERKDTNLPVMVFIHGGAFITGEGYSPWYDGSYISANQDVVVVTLNYRLGVLGFLAVPDTDITGNYGILDQQEAFRWVKNNIQAFGGDPNKVTIFGQSAGAMSVGLHLFSAPKSQDLFNAAIMESNPYGFRYKGNKDPLTIGVGSHFASTLECMGEEEIDVSCMKNTKMEIILWGQNEVWKQYEDILQWFGGSMGIMLLYAPVIDGKIITNAPMAEQAIIELDKPVIIGTNTNEGDFFVPDIKTSDNNKTTAWQQLSNAMYKLGVSTAFFPWGHYVLMDYPAISTDKNGEQLGKLFTDYFFTCSNRWVAKKASASVGKYAYVFNHVSPTNDFYLYFSNPPCHKKVCHIAELPFVFHNDLLLTNPSKHWFTNEEKVLSQQMVSRWGSFAKTGTPQPDGEITWPPFNSDNMEYLVFQKDIEVKDPFKDSHCELWDYFYDIKYKLGAQNENGFLDELLNRVVMP